MSILLCNLTTYRFSVLLIIFCIPVSLWAATPSKRTQVVAPPSEVIADVSYVKKGGVQAVQVDFALPVHYVSHFPAKHGDSLTVNLRFNQQEVPDVSQLPLLQSMTPPRSSNVPITEVTYLTDNEIPKLIIKFSRDVKFRVSQIMGITSLVIFLPDKVRTETVAKPKVDLPPIIPEEGDKKASKIDKMYRFGRRALQSGDNQTAIQIFSTLLSQPEHKYSRESLELLGVARERNGQKAHAKAAYTDYLEKYKKEKGVDKDSERVKQRLADLVVNRKKPKKRLKDSRDKKEREMDSTFVGSFAQFVDHRIIEVDIQQDVNQEATTRFDNQLSLNWRLRDDNWDIRNFFYGNYEYDVTDKETDGLEVGSMYSKIKNSSAGVYVTAGRQSATSTGVLSKFDGLLFGYDLTDKIRFNVVGGYPVLLTEKSKIQSNKLFTSVNLEFNDFWKSWDVSPYFYQQDVEGVENRTAMGAEVRFFHEKGDFFGLYDRDTFFDTTNIVLVRMKYLLQKQTSLKFNFDKRRAPSLQLENVLAQLDPNVVETVSDIFALPSANYTLEDLKLKALERSGESRLATIGISHSFSDVMHLTIDRTSTNNVSPLVTLITTHPTEIDPVTLLPRALTPEESVIFTLDSIPERSYSKSNDFSIQLVTSQSFYRNDSTIVAFRSSRRNDSSEGNVSFEYRWPYSAKLRFNLRMQLRQREGYDDDEVDINKVPLGRVVTTIKRTIPSLKINYRAAKRMRVYADLVYEDNRTTSTDPNSNATGRVKDFSGYVGYTWEF